MLRSLGTGISARMLMGFSAILAMMIAVTVVGVGQVRSIDSSLSTVNDVNSVMQRYAINFRGSVHDRAISLRDVVLMKGPDALQGNIQDIQRLADQYARSAVKLDAMFADPRATSSEEKAILASIKATEARTMPLVATVIAKAQGGDLAGASTILIDDARPAFVEWLARINQLIDLEEKKNQVVTTEARGIAERFSMLMLGLCAAALLAGVGFAIWNVSAIRMLRPLVGRMEELAEGKLDVELPATRRRDEIGAIVDAVRVFKDSLIRSRQMEDETASARMGADAQRKAAMRDMAERFESAVSGIMGAVSAAATELQSTARAMTGAASATASQSAAVAVAAEDASTNVTMVAASAEELGSSVVEIGRQVEDSARLAQSAVEEAEMTGKLVNALSEAASKVGDVVGIISQIAGQTNLLALNATIEAARAGEAGRGFAVVAAEVKELANQTAKATDEIARQIAAIQGTTTEAVAAIAAISTHIRDMSGKAEAIAAAVEEQGAATQEIVRNVGRAATGTNDVTVTITAVAGAADATGAAASQVLASASELSRQAGQLGAEVDRFLANVKAA